MWVVWVWDVWNICVWWVCVRNVCVRCISFWDVVLFGNVICIYVIERNGYVRDVCGSCICDDWFFIVDCGVNG